MRGTALLVAAFAAQAAAVPAPFAHAVAGPGCTQEDGRALEIVLASQPDANTPPSLRFEVPWGAWERAAGRPLPLVGLSAKQAPPGTVPVRAALQEAQGPPSWLGGTLTLERVDVGQVVQGAYDVDAGAGVRWQGRFSARWQARRLMCG